MIKTVIFDFNGTIIDDARFSVDIENELLMKRGYKPVTLKYYKEHFGFPVIDYYRSMGISFENEPFEVMSAEFIDEFNRTFLNCPLMPDATEVFEKLKIRGVRMVILSATEQNNLNNQVEKFGISGYFDAVIGTDSIHGHGKIDAAINWMNKAQIDRETAVMIGDSTHDYDVSKAIGVGCVLTCRGHQSRSRLEVTGAKVVDSLTEFCDIIL